MKEEVCAAEEELGLWPLLNVMNFAASYRSSPKRSASFVAAKGVAGIPELAVELTAALASDDASTSWSAKSASKAENLDSDSASKRGESRSRGADRYASTWSRD